jgi:hypothetical protein
MAALFGTADYGIDEPIQFDMTRVPWLSGRAVFGPNKELRMFSLFFYRLLVSVSRVWNSTSRLFTTRMVGKSLRVAQTRRRPRLLERFVGRLSFEPLEQRALLSLTVATDLPDYTPGSTAHISVSGIEVGDTVQFQMLHTDGASNASPDHDPWQVTDGDANDLDGMLNGAIQTSWYVDPNGPISSTFQGIVTDVNTGETLVGAFTEGVLRVTSASNAAFSPQNSPGVKDTTAITVNNIDSADVDTGKVRIKDSENNIVRELTLPTLSGNSSTTIDWDGKDESGLFVADGTYTAVAVKNGVEDSGTLSILVDDTAPIISATRAAGSEANSYGWNNSDVTVQFTAGDDLSGIASVSPDATLSSEGAGQSVTGTVTDQAGNTASISLDEINIDKTAPTIAATRAAGSEANSYGWNNSDVTVQFTAGDDLSGIASVSPDATLSSEGAGQSVTGTVTDQAGNTASITLDEINIDKTAPTISGGISSADSTTGWYNTTTGAPVAQYTASDDGAGLASDATGAFTFAEGTGLSHTFTVTDKAGNSNSVSFADIKVDLTMPVIKVDNYAIKRISSGYSATFDFHAEDNQDGSTFQYSVDGGDFVTCSSSVTLDQLPVGNHQLAFRAVDAAGNVGAAVHCQLAPAGETWDTEASGTFTIDAPGSSVGVFNGGYWFLDRDGIQSGNVRGGQPQVFGWNGATPVVGDWNGDGKTEIGVYNKGGWWLDTNGNGVYDSKDAFFFFGWDGATPVVGDWNGDGKDEVGVYNLGAWFRDINGNRTWDTTDQAAVMFYGWNGATPTSGDWNGDGVDEVGVYNLGAWFRDVNGNNQWDTPDQAAVTFYGWAGAKPVVGDWNADGKDDLGVYNLGYWFRDMNGNNQWDAPDQAAIMQFGWDGAAPVVGNWSSPASPLLAAGGQVTATPGTSALMPSQLQPIVNEAIARWAAAGLSPASLDMLRQVQLVVTDLPNSYLGLAQGKQISIDTNAAGHGWFVDATPKQDEEFVATTSASQQKAIDPRAVDRIDLLTVVEHELGHMAGLGDLDPLANDLMSGSLATGLRRTPQWADAVASALDQA